MDPSVVFTRRIFEFFRSAGKGAAGARRPLRILEAALFQRKQAARRARNAKEGLVVPPVLIASITRKCNLDCVGIVSPSLFRPDILNKERGYGRAATMDGKAQV